MPVYLLILLLCVGVLFGFAWKYLRLQHARKAQQEPSLAPGNSGLGQGALAPHVQEFLEIRYAAKTKG